ncbi:NIPSNAP family protein [uncultured Roseobacter sp.]|uniref:NIPSNAP family protein n=1 Tax=uncultured Roseobacter sp. TaxID=114847 RepID=UPI002625B63F|nr:NIPSNAP family protein [uncultured Roseobacter sp.]
MITCTLTYRIDPYQVDAFETYAKVWIHLVTRMGGTHHGYFLPHEGANDLAWAMFSFPSLAAYEAYRAEMAEDSECQAAFAFAAKTKCILSYQRSFTRPVLQGATPSELGLIA